MSSKVAETHGFPNYNLVDILSPEKYREMQNMLELKSGDGVRHGCGKKKCPCVGLYENCHHYIDREAQEQRLKAKTTLSDIETYYDHDIQVKMPDGLAGAG